MAFYVITFNTIGSLATDYESFTNNKEAIFNIEAITDGHAYVIERDNMEALYKQSKVWERLGRLTNQYYLTQLIQRNLDMYQKTAKARYDDFCRKNINLFQYVPLKHIASHLGMTIETLSRLRAGTY
jgi:CRP-like cAMP-binding protein